MTTLPRVPATRLKFYTRSNTATTRLEGYETQDGRRDFTLDRQGLEFPWHIYKGRASALRSMAADQEYASRFDATLSVHTFAKDVHVVVWHRPVLAKDLTVDEFAEGVKTNVWGTLKADVGEGFCPECERDLPGHYSNCPTRVLVTA